MQMCASASKAKSPKEDGKRTTADAVLEVESHLEPDTTLQIDQGVITQNG